MIFALVRSGVPTSRSWTSTSCQISGSIRLEIKCRVNVMSLNHLKTTPSLFMEILSSMKLVPVAKKVGTADRSILDSITNKFTNP